MALTWPASHARSALYRCDWLAFRVVYCWKCWQKLEEMFSSLNGVEGDLRGLLCAVEDDAVDGVPDADLARLVCRGDVEARGRVAGAEHLAGVLGVHVGVLRCYS